MFIFLSKNTFFSKKWKYTGIEPGSPKMDARYASQLHHTPFITNSI